MKMPFKTNLASLAVLVLCLGLGPVGSEAKPNPYIKPDQSWISIDGTVTSANPSSFMLDYGEGSIRVEIDDWDPKKEGRFIRKDDEVSVFGKVDADLYQERRIEASSVYVQNLGTYYYGSADDEEDHQNYWLYPHQHLGGKTVVKGTVTHVDDEEFTIARGTQSLTVNVDSMSYNPLDDKGYQKVDLGDVVSVSGQMDTDFWENKELEADTLVILVES